MTLGLVQHRCTLDPDENMRKAVRASARRPARGAQIVCLQELFRSQYFCQIEDHEFFDARRADSRAVDRGAVRAGARSSAS